MKFLIIIGIVFFIGPIILIYSNYDKVIIDKQGEIVKMRIEHLPKNCIGSKIRYNVIYSYKGKMFGKMARGNFCREHFIGEYVNMKYLEGYTTILKPDESAMFNLLSSLLLGITGLFISITQWLKIKSTRYKKSA